MRTLRVGAMLAVCLAAFLAAAPVRAGWDPGPDAVLESTYVGFIDQPAAGARVPANDAITISGWIVDRTAQGWAGVDDVHLYDGMAGDGGRFLGQARFAQPRPDVGLALGSPHWAASGFVATLPSGALAHGPHVLTVYAHTPNKGWWYAQVAVQITEPVARPSDLPPPIAGITRPNVDDRLSTKAEHFQIKGYALDPNAEPQQGIGIDRVQVYLDEPRGMDGSKFIGEADFGGSTPEMAAQYGQRFMESGFSIDMRPADFKAGNHHVYVYARSSLSGKETVVLAGFDMYDP